MLQINIFKCNLNHCDLHLVIDKRIFPFWYDVLHAWCCFFYNERSSYICPIWYNSAARILNSPFFWSTCYIQGLTFFNQLEGQCGDDLCNRFQLSLMDLNALVSLARKLKPLSVQELSFELVVAQKSVSRFVYRWMCDKGKFANKGISKWSEDSGVDISITDAEDCFRCIYVITNSKKLRRLFN